MLASEIRQLIERLAREHGFERCGVASAGPVDRDAYYRDWLAKGHAGTMAYLHQYVEQRTDASTLLPGARSVLVCALNYHQPETATLEKPTGEDCATAQGRIARYAWGDDYHRVIKRKLFAIVDALREAIDEPFEAKVCVDTAPLLEREYAMRAGVGWIGKNTLVLNEKLGSYFFLGAIVTTLDLPVDPLPSDHCGSCTRCLDACPTDAFPAPYEMDAARCISYLTIEHRGEEIPEEFHRAMGDWVFGCDVCQEVCPHNRAAPTTAEPRFAIRAPGPRPNLSDMLAWTDEDYRETLRASAIKRAKPNMLRRNARIAEANQKKSKIEGQRSD
jgi:epoxyqueuosine reductase